MARIGIDATAVSQKGKGVSNYQKNIIQALHDLDSSHEYFVFVNKSEGIPFIFVKKNWHLIQVPIWNHFSWEQFQLPYLAWKFKLDLFHHTSDRFSVLLNIPTVLLLFEIPHYRYYLSANETRSSNLYNRISERLSIAMFPQTLKGAKRILVSSKNTKKDLIEQFQVQADKIQVNYLGCAPIFQPLGDQQKICEIRKHLGATDGYVLHFATGDPRENTNTVIKSFEVVRKKFPNIKLVLACGGKKAQTNSDHIIYLPYLTIDSLVEVYQAAKLYVDPSSYEGFGFQIVEAMACGIPVISSTKTCIPEIVGDAGILLEPNDETGLAEQMIRVLGDNRLSSQMRLKGLERAKTFNWIKTAAETLNVYNEILNGPAIERFSEALKPRILLSHSGVQYVYKVARSLYSSRMLSRFFSTIYYKPDLSIYKIAAKFFGEHPWFKSIKERRYDSALPPQLIRSLSWLEISHQLWRKLSGGLFEDSVLTLKNDLFDKKVAKQLGDLSQTFDVFYGFSGSVLQCLKESKRLGKLTILDHHDIHHETARKLLQEEIDLNPDFAETIPYWPPYEPYLRRIEEEDRLADYHIVPSAFAKDTYVHAGMDPSKISVVHLGVDLSKFTPLNEPSESAHFRILFAGAIGQRKGIKYLLKAFKLLALPKAELVLAGKILGSGKSFEKYRHLFRHEKYIEPSLVPNFYRSGSVFVLPGVYDALGQVIIEAMACGLPVIVSENTAGHEVVRDGVDGFVIPIRNVEALCQKLLILYKDPKLRKWMGKNANKRAQEFGLEAYSEKLVNSILTIWTNSISASTESCALAAAGN